MKCFSKSAQGWAGFALAMIVASSAIAQQSREPFWLQGTGARTGESPRVRISPEGYLVSAGAVPGSSFNAGLARGFGTPEQVALSFLATQSRWFMDDSPGAGFRVDRTRSGGGRAWVRMVQQYKGVPVFGSGTIVQVRGNGVEFVTADVMHRFDALDTGALETTPTITGAEAQIFAAQWIQSEFGIVATPATAPQLAIYEPAIVGNEGDTRLVWYFEMANEAEHFREVMLVDAHEGKVAMRYSLVHDAVNRQIRNANNMDSAGTVVRSEGQAATGDSEVDELYDYLGNAHTFYLTEHGRDGIDGAGGLISATVRYCRLGDPCPYPNAFWDGSRLWFGQGFQADDVAAHELTHGVTQYEANLIYMNQSGAINESLSDMWGEWIDLTNGLGSDEPWDRWEIGEDLPGGNELRDMANPPSKGDPDRLGSSLFYTGPFDNGGVHTNSGVGNKLAYLLTDGGTFNGFTITGLGISLAADLMYECQTNLLTPASNYFDLYDAIVQASINIGLDAAQQAEVDEAGRAVEIKFIEGVSVFKASTELDVPEITLTWNNPSVGSFTHVRVRRSVNNFPSNPFSGGVLVYEGPAASFVDTSVSLDTLYFYAIWAFHGPDERSAPSNASAEAGVLASTPSERFNGNNGDVFDLGFKRISFWPNGPTAYEVQRFGTATFPSDPNGGTRINLDDDDFRFVLIGGDKQIEFYGKQYPGFFVGSNGRITFDGADTEFDETFTKHFSLPGISAFFDDLNPDAGGRVSYKQYSDRMAVTFENISEFGASNSNNFQVELYFSGLIRITFLAMDAKDGIVGVSPGSGTPLGFLETDLSVFQIMAAPVGAWSVAVLSLALGIAACARLGLKRRGARRGQANPPCAVASPTARVL